MLTALGGAEEKQEADRALMRRAFDGAEQRQQAAAAVRADRASAELRELAAEVEASANAERRVQDFENDIAEEARRFIRGLVRPSRPRL